MDREAVPASLIGKVHASTMLACSDCSDRTPQTGQLINNNLFLTVLKARSLRSGASMVR